MEREWHHGPFDRHSEYVHEIADIENLAEFGLRALIDLGERGMLTEQMRSFHPRALEEATNDFPRLHAQRAILEFGALERFVDDTIVTFLTHQWGAPKIMLDSDATNRFLTKTTVTLKELLPFLGPAYHVNDPGALAKFLLDKIKNQYGARLADELDQKFERPLGVVGLSGVIPPEIKGDLREMMLVRNVLVHRNGIVDDIFAKKLPKARWKLNEKIQISSADTGRYMLACYGYRDVIGARLTELRRTDPYAR